MGRKYNRLTQDESNCSKSWSTFRSIALHITSHDPANPDSLSSNIVTSVFEDKAGIIWVATDNGLNSFDKKTGIFKRYNMIQKIFIRSAVTI